MHIVGHLGFAIHWALRTPLSLCNPGHSPISQMEKPRCQGLAQTLRWPIQASLSGLVAHRMWA